MLTSKLARAVDSMMFVTVTVTARPRPGPGAGITGKFVTSNQNYAGTGACDQIDWIDSRRRADSDSETEPP